MSAGTGEELELFMYAKVRSLHTEVVHAPKPGKLHPDRPPENPNQQVYMCGVCFCCCCTLLPSTQTGPTAIPACLAPRGPCFQLILPFYSPSRRLPVSVFTPRALFATLTGHSGASWIRAWRVAAYVIISYFCPQVCGVVVFNSLHRSVQ